MDLCALLIDATPFAGQQMVVASGIRQDGKESRVVYRRLASLPEKMGRFHAKWRQ